MMLDRTDAIDWLKKFGYLAREIKPDNLEFDAALKHMQARYKLKADGFLGPITSRAMGLYRCGVPDIMRIVVEGTTDCKWQKNKIRYHHPANLKLHGHSIEDTANVIETAANYWTQYIPLKIERTAHQSEADVRIGIGRGRQYNFDGVGNTLAWANMPCLDTDETLLMMFDRDEPWTKNPKLAAGVYAMAVAVHEWGHVLGLDHSDNEADAMAAFYNSQIWTPQAGDISRIQSIYGEKKAGATTVSVSGTMKIDGAAVTLDLAVSN